MVSVVFNYVKRKVIIFHKLLFEAYKEWVRDKSANLAAGLAYYQILSIGPLVAFILLFSWKFWGYHKTIQETVPIIAGMFPPQFVSVIKFLLTREKGFPPAEHATFVGVTMVTFFLGIINYFALLKDSIELIWDHRRDKFGLIEAIKRNWDDFLTTLSCLAVIVIFFIIKIYLPHPFINVSMIIGPGADIPMIALRMFVQMIFVFILYSFFFKTMPPYSIGLREVFPAGILGGVLLEVGREIMFNVVGENTQKDTETSVAVSLLALLLWFFYSNGVLMFVAQFSKVYILYKRDITLKNLKAFYPRED